MPGLAAVRLVREAICQKERTKRCASSLLLPPDVFSPFASKMGGGGDRGHFCGFKSLALMLIIHTKPPAAVAPVSLSTCASFRP